MPQWMIRPESGMDEVVGRVARHAEPFHDGGGSGVGGDGERDDLGDSFLDEGVGHGGAGCFRRIASSPGMAGESPADFQGRCEVGLEESPVKAGISQERRIFSSFYDVEPVAVFREVRLRLNMRIVSPFIVSFCPVSSSQYF